MWDIMLVVDWQKYQGKYTKQDSSEYLNIEKYNIRIAEGIIPADTINGKRCHHQGMISPHTSGRWDQDAETTEYEDQQRRLNPQARSRWKREKGEIGHKKIEDPYQNAVKSKQKWSFDLSDRLHSCNHPFSKILNLKINKRLSDSISEKYNQ